MSEIQYPLSIHVARAEATPQEQKRLSLRQVPLSLKNLLSWISSGQHGAEVLESTSSPLLQKKTPAFSA